VALQPRLAVDGLPGADEAEPGIAEHDAVVGVPSAQHRPRYFRGDAADRGAGPDPARRRIAHPGLGVALVDILDLHAADLVRQIVILGARDRMRKLVEAELLQSRKKARQLLAPESSEHHLGRTR